MVRPRLGAFRRPIAVAVFCSAMLLIGVGQGPARASHTFDFTAVKGSAYGYFSSVGLFGNPPTPQGPAPTVTLPPGGSSVPITATAPTGNAQHDPASIFTTGPLNVSTQGSTGPSGPVTSSADILKVNRSGNEVFTAARLTSACTATGAGAGGSTTITSGTLQTDSGDDEANAIPNHLPVIVPVPANPAPNTPPVNGHIHFNGATDNFRYAFNEQFVNPDGSTTVNAAHQYLDGPTAVGDLFVGRSVCGATGTPIAHVDAPPNATAPQTAPGSPLGSAPARSPAEGLTNCAATVTVGSDGTVKLCDAANPPTASTSQTLTATLPASYAETARKKKRKKPKPGPVATGQTTIPAGQTVPVTVRLSAKAAGALRKKGKLRVKATIQARGVDGQTATVTSTVNLKPAKKAKRRRKR